MLLSAQPLRAAQVDELLDALGIDEMLEIMREEGLAYGEELGDDMFSGGTRPSWRALLEDIYDPEKMRVIMRRDFKQALDGADAEPLIAFFNTPTGEKIVSLELSARRAMIDEDVEAAARDHYRMLAGSSDPRLEQIQRFVAAGDLLEVNVAGALNASFQFYRGLVDGGGLDMSESEILSDVWSQEDETRDDTRDWLYGFLLLAYRPLSDEQLEDYIELSNAPEGKLLNQALFAGFNEMYDEISYALGLAVAQEMMAQDL
jgi:hypothetical protein